MSNPNNGGSFLPSADYELTGNWDFADATVTLPGGTVEDRGSIALTDLTNQIVTGGSTNLTTVNFPASSGAVTLTAPNTTDTLVGRATTDTLTNKTLTAPTITSPTITGTTSIGNGATLTTPVLSGTVTGTYTLGGTPTLASAAGVPYAAGVAAGYKVARVEMALDGSNPTSWATGLTTIVAAHVGLKGSAAPGVGTSVLTCLINGTSLDVYAWKVTATGDCTLIASTGTESFYGIAIGT